MPTATECVCTVNLKHKPKSTAKNELASPARQQGVMQFFSLLSTLHVILGSGSAERLPIPDVIHMQFWCQSC